jgi:hypothetical protein
MFPRTAPIAACCSQWPTWNLQLQPHITLLGTTVTQTQAAPELDPRLGLSSAPSSVPQEQKDMPFPVSFWDFCTTPPKGLPALSSICFSNCSSQVPLVNFYEGRFSVLFIEVQDKGCLISWLERSRSAWCSLHAHTYTQQKNTIFYIIWLHYAARYGIRQALGIGNHE